MDTCLEIHVTAWKKKNIEDTAGKPKKERPWISRLDNVTTWTSVNVDQCIWTVEDRQRRQLSSLQPSDRGQVKKAEKNVRSRSNLLVLLVNCAEPILVRTHASDKNEQPQHSDGVGNPEQSLLKMQTM